MQKTMETPKSISSALVRSWVSQDFLFNISARNTKAYLCCFGEYQTYLNVYSIKVKCSTNLYINFSQTYFRALLEIRIP